MCAHRVVQIYSKQKSSKRICRCGKNAANEVRVIETFGLVNHDSNAKKKQAIPLSASNSVLMGKYISSKKCNSSVLNYHTMFRCTMGNIFMHF